MELHQEQAQKADRAASAIGDALAKTLTEMRSDFAFKYDLDDQLVTLAIAKAAVGIAPTPPPRPLAWELSSLTI